MARMRKSTTRGYSLLELCVTLMLSALLIGIAAPPVRRALLCARVRSARDLVAAELAHARTLAVARGGAQLVLDLAGGRAWVECADTSTPPVRVASDPAVRLSADGNSGDTARIAFDGLGIGILASRTLRIRSAELEARLTVSGYGRVRAW